MTKPAKTFPLLATALTLLGLLILCTLGTWQMQRLSWKNDIIKQLDGAYDGAIDQLTFTQMDNQNFSYGIIEGKLSAEKSFFLSHTVKDGTPLKQLVAPLITKQGTLLINFGWVETQSFNHTAFLAHNNQDLRVTGLARAMQWNSFTPKNIPEKNLWYRGDIDEIATAKDLQNPIPVFIFADIVSKDLGSNIPNNERWNPNNNHKQYAFFWFAMALALLCIYYLRFIRKQNA